MIRLIASDVDGTLLQNGERTVNPQVILMIQRLKEKGVIFAACSGRQYPNLLQLFHEVKDDIAYICEDGALIKYQGKTISKTPMDHGLAMNLLEDIYQRSDCEILLSGETTSYLMPKKESYVHHVEDEVGNHVTILSDLSEVTEPFLKISVYNEHGIDIDSDYFTARYENQFACQISGDKWMDFVNPSVSKGRGLNILQDLFEADRDSTMCFGDNFNDIPMFQEAYYSYAMMNADPEIRKLAKHVTPNVESILMDVYRMI